MRTRAAVTMLATVMGALCGCGAVPLSKYYQLSAPGEVSSTAASDPLPVILLVGPLKASHLYREDRLVYATGNQEMGTYQAHRWAAPPSEMMRELLWRSLRASPCGPLGVMTATFPCSLPIAHSLSLRGAHRWSRGTRDACSLLQLPGRPGARAESLF